MAVTARRSIRPGGASLCHRCGLHTLRQYYSPELDAFAARFGERLWITGGWVREGLSDSNYLGDIDCIIVAGAQQIKQFAIAAGFDLRTAPLGAPRVVLCDGNHMDVIPVSGPTAKDAVLQAISAYNFSINSAAVNYLTGTVLRTPYWDDIDVITTASDDDIVGHLAEAGIPFSPNYFGTPKVITPNGLKVDIWALGGHTLETELSGYAHNLDAIAWSVRDRRMCDPLGVADAVAQRHLDISPAFIGNATAHDLHYTALKSIYLTIRHALTFSDRAAEVMRTPIVPEPFLIKHLIRLLRELCLCLPPQTISRAIAALENKLGACDAVRLVHTYS